MCRTSLLPQSSYVDPVIVMYRDNETVNAIVQRVLDTEEPLELVDAGGFTFCSPSTSPPCDMRKQLQPSSKEQKGAAAAAAAAATANGISSANELPPPRHLLWMITDKQVSGPLLACRL